MSERLTLELEPADTLRLANLCGQFVDVVITEALSHSLRGRLAVAGRDSADAA